MRNPLPILLSGALCLAQIVTAQNTNRFTPGVWQMGGDPLSRYTNPEIRGWICSFNWKDIEPSDNVWHWDDFDTYLEKRGSDLPIMLMVFTKENSPEWLYTSGGVPKVIERNSNGDSAGFAPHFANANYKFYFKRMIDTVAKHIAAYPESVRSNIIAIQACMGEEGDYIGYRGEDRQSQEVTVDASYQLSKQQFTDLYKEFSLYYRDAYAGSNPKISVILNAGPLREDNVKWALSHCPDVWFKFTTLGKVYQANDELVQASWLYPILTTKQNGVFIRGRSELSLDNLSKGAWSTRTPRNLFALFSSMIYWGMDFSNQPPPTLQNPLYLPAFNFFNKYADKADTAGSYRAVCILRDALDASDSKRFPGKTKGSIKRTNTQRYKDIQNQFSAYGAKLGDVTAAMGTMNDNLDALAINDVGWQIFPGNFERYIHQLKPNNTSVGYWNVDAPNDTNSIYGRFARGFDLANGKDALNFDVDNTFLNNSPLNGKYPVVISVTYLDKGQGSWQLLYDAQSSSSKPAATVNCSNSGQWKKFSVILNDAYFGNRAASASDFRIQNTGSENVIFAMVEMERPNTDASNVGLFASALSAFDTICINSLSSFKSFLLNGGFLNNSQVKIGPFNGYKFSFLPDTAYSDSLIINAYNTSFSQRIFVKMGSANAASYTGNIPVSGGGVTINVPVKGVVVNSSPALSPLVNNVSCNGAKNGSVNLNVSGGMAPFNYSWASSNGGFKDSLPAISGLSPANYTVNINSFAGCKSSATFTITEPEALSINLSYDSMLCKGGNTLVHVTASGGTTPYTGIGDFSVIAGRQTFTVTDAHGCTATGGITVYNGPGIAPDKPLSIFSAAADATGVCGGGNFTFSIDKVPTATSYTWKPAAGCTIGTAGMNSNQITLTIPAGFSTDSISVSAKNACGKSASVTKIIYAVPGKPGNISGLTTVSPLQTNIVYSVPQVNGLTYTWAVPSGVKIVSGQNTNSITVNWGSAPGNINVKASNNCGGSLVSILPVFVTSNTLTASVSSLPAFDTVCMNGLSNYRSFTLAGSGLSGSNVVVGPLNGFKLSTSNNGIYTDSLIINNYGSSFSQPVFIKFNPSASGLYNTNLFVNGGGASTIAVSVNGLAVNSSPSLSALINNVSCNGAKNGALDLITTGGTGPFTYTWSGSNGGFKDSLQDVSNLAPATYTVSVGSFAGCKTSASYTITEPEVLGLSLSYDSMVCKGGTTMAHVSATGGTTPYTGIGDFSVIAGRQNFTVNDAKGCTITQGITVYNGVGIAPEKPLSILSAAADATGLCGGGKFNFNVDAVATATAYTWKLATGASITSADINASLVTIAFPKSFNLDSISVAAKNVCGSSAFITKTLTAVPVKPGIVSGYTSVTPLQTNLKYSVPQVNGLTYTWAVPSGVKLVSGQNTNSIIVNWGSVSGNINVKASNNCGSSTNSILTVNVASNTLTASASSLPAFDTVCINGLSSYRSFTLAGSGLSGSDVVVGPLNGFKLSTSNNGIYSDSLIISNYGSSFTQGIFIKFNPANAGSYNSNLFAGGGGAAAIPVSVNGIAVNSSPSLSAIINNVSCNGAKNGALDLITTGGTGPFTYSWASSNGGFKDSLQDVSNLSPATYTVSVSSFAGCKTSAGFAITEPQVLSLSLSYDSMVCKGGSTMAHVSASGGTTPYSGTGDFSVIAARQNFTVTDAKGCMATQGITVYNGVGIAPDKPVNILSAAADATGLCGGGNFTYSVNAVPTALSYKWKWPAGISINSFNADSSTIVLTVPQNFNSDSVTVYAKNVCGSSASISKIITALPAKPGVIAGPTAVNSLQTGIVYSVPQVNGLTYTWAVPTGAKITSGQGTAAITVNWGSVSGNINVKAANNCGSSTNSILGVTTGSNSVASKIDKEVPGLPSKITAYPNPVHDIAYISFDARTTYKFTVTLTALNGRFLTQQKGVTYKGKNNMSFDMRNYASGTYFITFMNSKEKTVRVKIIKN